MRPPPSFETFAENYALVSANNRRSLDKLSVLLRRLNEEGIEFILLKGADLLTRFYGAQGLRSIGDVDLLVHEEDLPRLDRTLRALGLKPKIDGNAAYIDDEGSFPVDIATKIWYLPDDGPVWERALAREALGTGVRSMEATDCLLYLCAWVGVHRAWLGAAFAEDVRLLAASGEVDWDRFASEAVASSLKLPLRRAFEYVLSKRPAEIPDRVMAALSPAGFAERGELFLLRRLVTEQRLPRLGHLLVLLTRPRWARAASLGATLVPGDRFLGYRYGESSRARLAALRAARPFYIAAQAALLCCRIAARLLGLPHATTR